MKDREQVLKANLRRILPQSSVAEDLFEYLAIRIESEKEKLCKDINDTTKGRLKELSELLDLFSVTKSGVE